MNPDFELKVHVDLDGIEDLDGLPWKRFRRAWCRGKSYAHQTNFLRMYHLYKCGGIYVDVDSRPIKPFTGEVLENGFHVVNSKESDPDFGPDIDNYFMSCNPGHWFLKFIIFMDDTRFFTKLAYRQLVTLKATHIWNPPVVPFEDVYLQQGKKNNQEWQRFVAGDWEEIADPKSRHYIKHYVARSWIAA